MTIQRSLEVPADPLARLALVEQKAKETFGDVRIAEDWLCSKNAALGGCAPLSLVKTAAGTREVLKVLVAIAHGGVV